MNIYMSAITRAARKNLRLQEKMKKADWKTGRETHQVTMTPQAWYSIEETCKANDITTNEFFENMVKSFMKWYVKEWHRKQVSPKYKVSDPLHEAFEKFFKFHMRSNFESYRVDNASMPSITEIEKTQTIYINE